MAAKQRDDKKMTKEVLKDVVEQDRQMLVSLVMSNMDRGVSTQSETRNAQLQNLAVLGLVIAYVVWQFSTVDMNIWRGWSIEEKLFRLVPANWNAYEEALAREPLFVKSVLTGATYFIGDWIAQSVENKGKNRDPLLIDRWRLLRNTVLGFVLLGPIAHYYYDWNASWPFPWFFKLFIDQTSYVPFHNTIYFMSLELLAGKRIGEAWKDYKGKFWDFLFAGWRLWPWVNILTYTIIPIRHRLLWVDSLEIVYAAILSLLANEKDAKETPAGPSSEQDSPPPPPAAPAAVEAPSSLSHHTEQPAHGHTRVDVHADTEGGGGGGAGEQHLIDPAAVITPETPAVDEQQRNVVTR